MTNPPTHPPIATETDAEYAARWNIPASAIPDNSLLVTEDDEPVDNLFAEKQQRLLACSLNDSWQSPDGKPFQAMTNVGLFYKWKAEAIVPDVMLALDVPPEFNPKHIDFRSFIIWSMGSTPGIVIEIVSDSRGKELSAKREKYRKIGVGHYAMFDPFDVLKGDPLEVYELRGRDYQRVDPAWLPALGLGLKLWDGKYEGVEDTWLRWCDAAGDPIPTGEEARILEKERADLQTGRVLQLEKRLDDVKRRADGEAEANRLLREKLKAAGIDPDA